MGKRCPYTYPFKWRRVSNCPNTGDMKGHRIFLHGVSVNKVRQVLGRRVKKVRVAGSKPFNDFNNLPYPLRKSQSTRRIEIIHSDNRGLVFSLVCQHFKDHIENNPEHR